MDTMLGQALPAAIVLAMLVPFVNGRPQLPGFVLLAATLVSDEEQTDATYQAQIMDAVSKALSRLPHHQADLVRLSFYAGLSPSELAEKLQLPLGTVKSRLRLAFERLRNHLSELKS